MVAAIIGGAGLPLPLPPNNFGNIQFGGSNLFNLNPGSSILIPAGTWFVAPGSYSFLQYMNPITGLWSGHRNRIEAQRVVESDGTNFRIANLTGCPTGALVTNVGSAYTSPPTVTASAGGSTWLAILGGAVTTISVTTAGSGYTLPPIVLIVPPAMGGTTNPPGSTGNVGWGVPGAFPAAASAAITSGAVSSITLIDQGAGYAAAPQVFIIPNPADPNINSIVNATATAAIGGAGTVTAVVCTYIGTQLTAVPTLTFSGGAGSGAAATVNMCFALTGVTTATAGAGLTGTQAAVITAGGYNTATPGAVLNPTAASPISVRTANVVVPITTGALGTAVIGDAGLFQAPPIGIVVQAASSTAVTTTPAVTLAVGGVQDRIGIQPL